MLRIGALQHLSACALLPADRNVLRMKRTVLHAESEPVCPSSSGKCPHAEGDFPRSESKSVCPGRKPENARRTERPLLASCHGSAYTAVSKAAEPSSRIPRHTLSLYQRSPRKNSETALLLYTSRLPVVKKYIRVLLQPVQPQPKADFSHAGTVRTAPKGRRSICFGLHPSIPYKKNSNFANKFI